MHMGGRGIVRRTFSSDLPAYVTFLTYVLTSNCIRASREVFNKEADIVGCELHYTRPYAKRTTSPAGGYEGVRFSVDSSFTLYYSISQWFCKFVFTAT